MSPKKAARLKKTGKSTRSDQRSKAATAIPEWFTIDSVDQLNAIAHPLRQKIMAEFVEESRTTKQVAERLGEPPTRLYHHVDALAKHGLLVLEREVPKRGTVEKYYRAVARQFTVAEDCLGEPGFQNKSSRVVSKMIDDAKRGILRVLSSDTEVDQTVAVNALVQTTQKEMEKLSEAMMKPLSEHNDKVSTGGKKKAETRNYRVVLMIYPEEAN